MTDTEAVEIGRPLPAIDRLAAWTGSEWENLTRARSFTEESIIGLRTNLNGLDNEDCSVVVFGSMARGEATRGSDLVWTFLIDGRKRSGGKFRATSSQELKESSEISRSAIRFCTVSEATTTPMQTPPAASCYFWSRGRLEIKTLGRAFKKIYCAVI